MRPLIKTQLKIQIKKKYKKTQHKAYRKTHKGHLNKIHRKIFKIVLTL